MGVDGRLVPRPERPATGSAGGPAALFSGAATPSPPPTRPPATTPHPPPPPLGAEHDGRRRPFGPAAGALGYRIGGSSRVYFAGDTDLCPELDGLAGQVDLALLPVWGWGPRLGTGHLDPGRAAEAVSRIRPRVAIPIHWGTFYPFAFARLWPKPLGDPPRDFARETARVAPETDVRILAPGEETGLGG